MSAEAWGGFGCLAVIVVLWLAFVLVPAVLELRAENNRALRARFAKEWSETTERANTIGLSGLMTPGRCPLCGGRVENEDVALRDELVRRRSRR